MRRPLTEISVSSISDFQNDRLRWCYRWLENRVPIEKPVALAVGTVVHRAFERFFTQDAAAYSLRDALFDELQTFVGVPLTDKEREAHEELTGLLEPLAFWKDQFPIGKTLEVETPFAVRLSSGLSFVGRPDRVAELWDGILHIQTKTIAGNGNVGMFLTLARRNLHELTYGSHLREKYADRYRYLGTLYNVIRKLKYRSKVKSKAEPEGKLLHKPDEFFCQSIIGIDDAQIEAAWRDVNAVAFQMLDTQRRYIAGDAIPSNRGFDAGIYGRSLDPYTMVMLGEISLDDDAYFTDREDTYEDTREADAKAD